jgi:hypothetical protein
MLGRPYLALLEKPMKRVLVIINKWWECDPALLAMLNDNARPVSSPWPTGLQPPRQRPVGPLPAENPNPQPRATFGFSKFAAEIWCISDLLEHLPGVLQSSSEQKAKLLPRIFSSGTVPDLVIAVGTAGTPYDYVSQNGNTCVGTKVFIHDGHPGGTNPNSNWSGTFDQVIESALTEDVFHQMLNFDTDLLANKFLAVPANNASLPKILADFDNVALGTVNVTDYLEYKNLDPQTVQKFGSLPRPGRAASIETTHGIIRAQSQSPFLFVSGITDRLGHFDEEVGSRGNGQNTAAAYNAGVTVIWLLVRLDQFFSSEIK